MSGIKMSEEKAVKLKKEILIYDLRCFGLERAEGIEDCNLRFSWKIKKAGNGEINQSAYEIQILKEGQVLYDTGKTVQRESKNIQVEVPGLISSDKYEFRIKIWDESGNESPWSEKAVFITGILDRKEWNDARFIIADKQFVNYMTDSVWYRKQIFVKESVRQAVLHVAGIGIHEVYINGEKIGERVLAPAKSKINDLTRVMYVTYDVTAYLHEGENVIGIWNDAYWARQSELPVDPAVRCLLKIKEKTGSQIFVTDTDWECRASNISHRGGWEWSDFGGETVRGTSDDS